MALTTRDHPGLGTLRWDDTLNYWEVEVPFAECKQVALCLSAEKEYQVFATPDELFPTGVTYLEWARRAEERCRNHIADELLDCYNEGWVTAECDPAESPPGVLTRAEFIKAIHPCAIHLYPAGNAVWSYSHDYLFGDCVIQVWVSKDGEFSGAHLGG